MPDFRVGDTLRVGVRVVEGSRERVQEFEGVVIRRRSSGINENFTARKISYVNPEAGGTSGTYMDGLFKKMGISDQVRAKVVWGYQGSQVAAAVEVTCLNHAPQAIRVHFLITATKRPRVHPGAFRARRRCARTASCPGCGRMRRAR